MKEYMLIYRNDFSNMAQVSAEQMAALMQRWMGWMGQVRDKGQLVSQGNRLVPGAGKVVKANNVVTNGPYAEIKESIGGYSIVKAESFEAAAEIAKGCPILGIGGNVEVREVQNLG